ncbi:MAG TPA: TonB-dependent receptor [Luteibacter sp.]|uniref:TonB-dependent receptor domain-containing protein n=1 Tax=Luteibacter sp. TaxID=1886636 RepID=UPI002B610DF3|nr:TonB-dependent receptor [Luteibacter sp.]HVI55708.1 TonB-dependent receptor [Luteibacter sp.]
MKRNNLACALAAFLLAPVASTAWAQSTTNDADPQAASGAPSTLQTITVTGSAIPRIDTETASPVTTISAKDIARSGYTTISDVVRSISADNSGSIPNSFTSGFAAGSSGVALRGLTVNSTLVLIDGHRAANYAVADDGQRSFVDLNTIPLAAVDRIEVLKDGASSLYGADAIAGVVNVILKPGYQGAEATADIGNSAHGGGFTRKGSFLVGGGDLNKDGYNAYFSAQFQEDNAISAGDRGFPYNTADLSSIGGANLQTGQPANGSGSIYGSVTPGTLGTPGDVTTGIPNTGATASLLTGGCGAKGTLTNDGTGTYCQQNTVAQYGQIQAKTKEGGVYGRLTMKINDTTKAYVSLSYMETKTDAIASPAQIQSGTPNNTDNIALPVYLSNGSLNPNNPFAANGQAALLNYAFGDIPRGSSYDNHNLRIVGDVAGTWGEWNYDAALVLNHTSLDSQLFGYLSYAGLINAVNTGSYNFLNPASNGAAVRNALAPGYDKTSTSDLDALDLAANRTLFDLPGGALGMAAGIQLRHEAQNDPTLNPGNEFQGLGNAQTKGSRDVEGAYLEFDAPLLDSLEADLSGRVDHYSDIGTEFAPKLGLKWKALDWLAVRGTFSKGVRAPSFSENGSSSSEGFVTYNPPADFAAAHGNNGYVQAYQLAEFTDANKNIKPERAKSYTLGVVLQPTSWLNASFDYYHIKKTDVITSTDANAILDAYYAGQALPAGTQVIADKPDPLNPNALARPIEVVGSYINANSLKTDGLDVDLQAHFAFGNGIQYISDFSGTDIFTWKLTLPDGTVESFSGTHGPYNLSSGAGTPRYRESWSNTMIWNNLTLTGTFYHTSGLKNTAPDVYGSDCIPDGYSSCRVGSFTEFNLTGSYQFTPRIAVTASVMNAFDRKAPLDVANYAATNYNPTYAQDGAIGRFFNLGVKVKL